MNTTNQQKQTKTDNRSPTKGSAQQLFCTTTIVCCRKETFIALAREGEGRHEPCADGKVSCTKAFVGLLLSVFGVLVVCVWRVLAPFGEGGLFGGLCLKAKGVKLVGDNFEEL